MFNLCVPYINHIFFTYMMQMNVMYYVSHIIHLFIMIIYLCPELDEPAALRRYTELLESELGSAFQINYKGNLSLQEGRKILIIHTYYILKYI